ncbi:unnamed protein product, partial [Durusdinium trenchii]
LLTNETAAAAAGLSPAEVIAILRPSTVTGSNSSGELAQFGDEDLDDNHLESVLVLLVPS